MAPNEIAQDEGEPAPPGAAAADSNDVPDPVQIDPGDIGPAPVKPHHSCSKINSIRDGPLFIPATAIGTALKSRKTKHSAVTYRIGLLSDTIDSLTRAFT